VQNNPTNCIATCIATFEHIDTFPCPSKPTIQSVNNGRWTSFNTWEPKRLPNSADVVLVKKHIIEVDQVPVIVGTLCNYGLLSSQKDAALEIWAPDGIKNFGTIRGRNGGENDLSFPGRGRAGKDIILKAGLNIERYYKGGGFWRSSVERAGPIDNQGFILGGDGEYGHPNGGKGGDVIVLGRNVTNDGMIRGGRGGHSKRQGGQGGLVQVFGRLGGSRNPPIVILDPVRIQETIPKPPRS
jgi:hypothetical protein